MPINSKRKGSRGEREFVDFLKSFGLKARRTQQFCGRGDDSADVVCEELSDIHFEIKRTETISPYKAIKQAETDAKGKRLPTVFHKRNNQRWIVILDAQRFIQLLLENEVQERKNETDEGIQERIVSC